MVKQLLHPIPEVHMTRYHRNELLNCVCMGLALLVLFLWFTDMEPQMMATAPLLQTKLVIWLMISAFWVGSAYMFVSALDIAREAKLVRI
ncbi:MAG: hypothetical protein HYT69_02730 [Candidatus Zambryskibacteria bacterium]|nr:hypothetical protein [Candidatus Zambryskibacteria bacterium]